MKKDKEWLFREIRKFPCDVQYGYVRIRAVDILPLIEQLDEPEKVVIPQFVADWIETTKKYSRSINYLMNYEAINKESRELALWCFESGNDDNLHNLARAWLDGYEIEKEKLYYVLDKLRRPILAIYEEEEIIRLSSVSEVELVEKLLNSIYKYRFTEKQIKDYDERFWPFAVEISE